MNNGAVAYSLDSRCNGHGGCGSMGWGPIPGYSDTYGGYTHDGGSYAYGPAPGYIVTPNTTGTSNYWAYTCDIPYYATGVPGLNLYNSARTLFGGTYATSSIYPSEGSLHRYESVRSGTTIYTYMDGTLNKTHESVPGTSAYSFGMGSAGSIDGVAISGYYDDPSFGDSFSTTALISVMPHSWYIKSDMIDPSNFAMINSAGDQVYADHFNVQWSLGAYADGWQATQNPPDTRYKITIAAPSGMKVYDEYIKISDYGTAAGIVSVPMNNTYIGNQPLEYGLYWVTLYDGTAVKSQDYFYVLGTGATVTWGSPSYPTGSTATVSYSIPSSYYDTATYNYEIKILDAYGTVKKTQTISGSSGSISFTMDSSTYADGIYYAELVAVKKSDSSEIVMNYGITEINSYIPISGYVVDQNNAALQGASVNVTQGTSTLISVSNASGYYSSSNNWLSGSQINMTTNLSGYTNDYAVFSPLAADVISRNITLVNLTPTYSGVAIGGVVKDNQYYSTIPGATVYERVNGSSAAPAITTANAAAYYRFDNLVNGTVYDVWSSKAGYANSTIEQKLAVGA
ncbi:MAG: carboxypeptidase-like regulatory domain-containing protein, partial [Dehalococcoidales bacterium]|nr:carboxypeptidase-like regulatory domain-containing protein [Dehalococcoidales bacterium]